MTQIYCGFISGHRQLKGISIISKPKKILKTLAGKGFGRKLHMKPKLKNAFYLVEN
jgi:hypothetical protein